MLKIPPKNVWGKQLITARQTHRFTQSSAERGRIPGGAVKVQGSNKEWCKRFPRKACRISRLCLETAPASPPPPKNPPPAFEPQTLWCPASPVGLGHVGCVLLCLFLISRDLLRRQPLHHHGQDTRAGGQPARRSPATNQRKPQARLGSLFPPILLRKLFW